MPRFAYIDAALACAAAAALAIGPVRADDMSDMDVLALAQKHCVPCHARMPTHPAFDKPPRNLVLETIDQIKQNAAKIREQVVEDRDMPLGNSTDLTDDERDALGRWLDALK